MQVLLISKNPIKFLKNRLYMEENLFLMRSIGYREQKV